MKTREYMLALLLCSVVATTADAGSWIGTNLLGCLPQSVKAVVQAGEEKLDAEQDGASGDHNVYVEGGIVRTNPNKKQISLVFTAADKADGADAVMLTLKKHGIKGAFFFTGEFYERFPEVVRQLIADGHYVGSHSYGHLLYMPWNNRDSMLVSRDEFENDMMKSYELMRQAGINKCDATLFVPPYEHYNKNISAWAKGMGLQLVNFTPGTLSNADYTTPDMGKSYRSSDTILKRIMEVEKKQGLNGHIMLMHLGTDSRRTDKFYNGSLDKMIKKLKRKGYRFVPLQEAINN